MEVSKERIKVSVKAKNEFNDVLYLEDSLVTLDKLGINVHLDFNEYNSELELLRNIQKAAKSIKSMGYSKVELVNNDYYSWNVESAFAFSQGFRKLKNGADIIYPQNIIEDKSFDSLLKIIAWTRKVIDLPGNKLTPESMNDYLQELSAIVNNPRFTIKQYKNDQLQDKELVGLMTVGKGSGNKPCLYELEFNPGTDSDEVFVALVGKGITFDTGGYSLKPSDYMKSMHSDMGGAATVAGAIALAAINNYSRRIKAYLCCAENMISSTAMKIGDIINYPNGKSVVIDNTDAEGRLVLADGLIIASKEAKYILDAATLTGAAKVALGRDYNAVLGLNRQLSGLFVDAATTCNEYAWELPFAKFHLGIVSSELADITNSASGDSLPGATCAAAFLSNFVKNTDNWIHIDLSASYQKSPNEIYNVGAKGHGVRSIYQYLVELNNK